MVHRPERWATSAEIGHDALTDESQPRTGARLQVVTRNVRSIFPTGCRCLNPFSPEPRQPFHRAAQVTHPWLCKASLRPGRCPRAIKAHPEMPELGPAKLSQEASLSAISITDPPVLETPWKRHRQRCDRAPPPGQHQAAAADQPPRHRHAAPHRSSAVATPGDQKAHPTVRPAGLLQGCNGAARWA